MGSDRTDPEPDEWDPEEEFRDPDSDSITIPDVRTGDAGTNLRTELREEHEPDPGSVPELSATDAPEELQAAFWVLVLVVNAALLAASLGLLYLLFEGNTSRGVPLLVGGAALFAFAGHRYRSFPSSTGDPAAGADEPESAATDGDANDADADGTGSDPLNAGETPSGDVSERRIPDESDTS